MPSETTTPQQCRHIKPDGHRCGSPALRGEHFCYYHAKARYPGPRQPQVNSSAARRSSTFDLPSPADLAEHTGVGLALGLILHKIAHNEIDPRRAGLLLYGLQIASMNLKRNTPAKPLDLAPLSVVSYDRDGGTLAPEAELGPPEEDRRKGRGLVESILKKLDREKQAEEEEFRRRQKAFAEERAQREEWARQDAQRHDAQLQEAQLQEAQRHEAQRHAVSEASQPFEAPEAPVAPPSATQTLDTLHAQARTNNGPCRGAQPHPQGNRAERRRLHRLLNRGARRDVHSRTTTPEVRT